MAVAPRAGAWIETRCRPLLLSVHLASPPVRGRGSKQTGMIAISSFSGRPPCGGVDRNSMSTPIDDAIRLSPPVRGRGSKHGPAYRFGGSGGSPPVRGRGSKRTRAYLPTWGARSPPVRGRGSKLFQGLRLLPGMVVAPRAGAWIETLGLAIMGAPGASPPVRGRGSKHFNAMSVKAKRTSPPVRGRGSKLTRGGGVRK